AFEFGECIVHGLGFDQLVAINAAGLTPESTALLQSLSSDCRTQIGG
ncbi:MAG: hypothetical protein QOJ98_1746, partial [Acidobacteriota bacterium]|nr:hypothetical protein [Acidobacteriota bacterium]